MERREALQQAIDEISRQRAEILRQRAEIARLESVVAESAAAEPIVAEPIAIVGMACRLPGAPNIDAYWDLLSNGRDAVTEVPRDRWRASSFYDADPSAAGKMYTRQGAFIDGVQEFDPQFFGIAPREAQNMDPQQRVLLEVAWEALEDANIAPRDLYGTDTGVFVGITCFDHAIRISQSPENFNAYAGTGSALNMAPGRLSYVLGLNGPSMAIDTACSSSLVGLHLACQSLRAGETNAALVGGVHLILSPEVMVSFSQARMLAPDGRSKTFDASADGYSRGEGCGVVVLKRLSDAVANHDRILGLIRGTAVNQDGPSGGLTVPNGAAQQRVIRRALDAAGVEPAVVAYVEAHGTGTSLGDPIEVEALAAVYGTARPKDRPILVGSVKTNIGHLEPAAGMAGLIKVLLAFRHGVIPKHLHFNTPNPHIPWSELPVKVAAEATPWPRGGARRLAGLSAFGFSGTNGHVIIEEPPMEVAASPATTSSPAREQLIVISARTASALSTLAGRYAEMLSRNPSIDLASLAYAAASGRSHFPFRLALIAGSVADARAALQAFVSDSPKGELESTPPYVSTGSHGVRTGKAGGADYRSDTASVNARLADAYERRDLQAIATLFLEGVEIDWARLFASGRPAHVTLPSYPFERQRYWIETSEAKETTADAAARYALVWAEAGPASKRTALPNDRRWAVAAGGRDATSRSVEPMQSLVDKLAAMLAEHLVTAEDATDIIFVSSAQSHADAGRSCLALLSLIHKRRDAGGAAPRIWIVTHGALPQGGVMTEAGAAQAPLAAFARVVGLEHPELFGRLIDLDPADRDAADTLLGEILRRDDTADDRVAIRNGKRFVERVERAAQEASAQQAPSADAGLRLRSDASYLITGGLGRIGRLVAKDLVSRGARHLYLVTRHGITSGDQQAAVAALESLGATVHVVTADVADRAAMASLIENIPAATPLAGVIHAAGLPGYTDIANLTIDGFSDVLRPKVQGAWHLHELTRGLPLDFFVCFSSISSAWGSRGQAHYSAANAYLDALAYLRRAEGLPAVTINWGPWVEGGMTTPEVEALLRRVGIRPLQTTDALSALAELGTGAAPQVVVADIDLVLFKGSYEARGHRPLLERLDIAATDRSGATGSSNATPPSAIASDLSRRLDAAPPADRERLLIEAIQREVADVLELGDAAGDPDQGLFEMGLDSLMALELRTRLESLASRSLPATLVFDYPTSRAIARFLLPPQADPAQTPVAPTETSFDAAIDDLTEAEAEALLLKKLNAIR